MATELNYSRADYYLSVTSFRVHNSIKETLGLDRHALPQAERV